ncbi:MAG: hypothetical protein IGS48_12445 [Oscillatoriales cyanobacterium C42_A2020_001]|nr:hypothetical protein [Leptolyngbyaceae cyanobacterium C42_A2020_001]
MTMKLRFAALGLSLAIAPVFALAPDLADSRRSAIAQIIRSEGAWRKVYEQIPELPRENQYVDRETGKVAEDNTLVSRLIRYHLYVRGRPPFYRLDWKITLAEYLGLSGQVEDSDYPSAKKLNKNPLDGDLAAIRKLNRIQRDALVQALVDAFVPQSVRSPQVVPKPVIQLPPGTKE